VDDKIKKKRKICNSLFLRKYGKVNLNLSKFQENSLRKKIFERISDGVGKGDLYY